MLVICNGVMKGGSTWVVQIIQQLDRFQRIPSAYQDTEWQNSSLRLGDLERLENLSFHRDGDYYCKQHFHRKKYIRAVTDPQVKVLNIVRDLRDMVVSWVFHQRRLAKIPDHFTIQDLFDSGQIENWLGNIIKHQRNWHGRDALSISHLMSYERLHGDFESSLQELISFLRHPDIHYSKDLSEQIFRATDYKKVTGEDPNSHVRKGLVGDHQNHLTEDQDERICRLARELGYGQIKDQMRRDFPQLEPYLHFTDIGLSDSAAWRWAAKSFHLRSARAGASSDRQPVLQLKDECGAALTQEAV